MLLQREGEVKEPELKVPAPQARGSRPVPSPGVSFVSSVVSHSRVTPVFDPWTGPLALLHPTRLLRVGRTTSHVLHHLFDLLTLRSCLEGSGDEPKKISDAGPRRPSSQSLPPVPHSCKGSQGLVGSGPWRVRVKRERSRVCPRSGPDRYEDQSLTTRLEAEVVAVV